MDGRTVYSKVLKMIDENELRGKTIHLDKLKTLIRMYIGSQEKSVISTLKVMNDLMMMTETEPFQYHINYDNPI